MRAHIIQADIDAGESGSADRCPVALALHRASGGSWLIYYDLAVKLRGTSYVACIPLPSRVAAWVAAFDAGRQVRPLRFELPDLLAG